MGARGTRHHTKRATISRKVKRYKSQLSIFEKRAELMQLAECRHCTDFFKERESYEADEKSLSKSIKRMENQFQVELYVFARLPLYYNSDGHIVLVLFLRLSNC